MIQVIERVEKTLVYLSENRKRGIPLSEIADSLDLNRATCANIYLAWAKQQIPHPYREDADLDRKSSLLKYPNTRSDYYPCTPTHEIAKEIDKWLLFG